MNTYELVIVAKGFQDQTPVLFKQKVEGTDIDTAVMSFWEQTKPNEFKTGYAIAEISIIQWRLVTPAMLSAPPLADLALLNLTHFKDSPNDQ